MAKGMEQTLWGMPDLEIKHKDGLALVVKKGA